MKTIFTRPLFIIFGMILMNQSLRAETDTLTCYIYMYSKTIVGCQSYVSCGGNGGTYATYIWDFDGGTIVSGTGSGPYWITWNTTGNKTVSVTVIYGVDTCSSSKVMHVIESPAVYYVGGGGSYPQGGQGVHIYLSWSQLHTSYNLYLNGGQNSVATMAGTGGQLDFGLFTAPGVYKCKAHADSTQGSCLIEMFDSAVVSISGYVPGQYICLVSYDTTFNRNKIFWYKTTGQHIDHYNIYRQTYQYDMYAKIAEVPFADPNLYIDTTADPLMMAYRYKISGTDSTDSESPLSPYHKTIHLEVSPGVSGFNLIWNTYEGFPFATYKIHRKLGTGPWEVIDSIASDLISYTDRYVTSGLAYYYIEVIRPYPCYLNLKSGEYGSVVSNIGVSAPVGMDQQNASQVLIYPNPTRHALNIVPGEPVTHDAKVQLFNMQGQKLIEASLSSSRNVFDISNLPAGFYFLRITDDRSTCVRKIIKE